MERLPVSALVPLFGFGERETKRNQPFWANLLEVDGQATGLEWLYSAAAYLSKATCGPRPVVAGAEQFPKGPFRKGSGSCRSEKWISGRGRPLIVRRFLVEEFVKRGDPASRRGTCSFATTLALLPFAWMLGL